MTADRPFLPYGRHSVDEDDIQSVINVISSDFLTTGPVVEAFEDELSLVTGSTYAIAVSSGTAALHLAALALDLGPGDAVIVPSTTFLATANAPKCVGAKIIFADVDPDNGLMTPSTLEEALKRSGQCARAVFPVHVNGQTVDMQSIAKLPGIERLSFVEDACHALGGYHAGPDGEQVAVGSNEYSHLSTFSFHPVKTVAMGEGGAITTNDPGLAKRLRTLRNIGITRESRDLTLDEQAYDSEGQLNPWYYEMEELGYNYRASALHCALGLSQLKKLRRFVAKRGELIRYYLTRLESLAPLVKPITHVKNCNPSWHLCAVLIDFDAVQITRATVMKELEKCGVGTQVHYIPVHRQPYYRRTCEEVVLPGADAYYDRVLSLPLFFSMTFDDVDFVVESLQQVLGS